MHSGSSWHDCSRDRASNVPSTRANTSSWPNFRLVIMSSTGAW